MFRELERTFREYESAVLSYKDLDGYPTSLRVRPKVDVKNAVVRLDLATLLPIAGAPASLLVHAHDDALWNQTSLLVRGRLVPENNTHVFVPTVIVPGIEQSVLAFGRFVLESRRAARRYLTQHGLPRPVVPWSDIRRLVEISKRPK
jgi:hypothetical protein